MTDKEVLFYNKKFNFSYSSLKKVINTPKLFYNEKVLFLKDEEKIESHLIEGKVIHCLLLEKEKINDKFKITPAKKPSENLVKVLRSLALKSNCENIMDLDDDLILEALKDFNLYQSLVLDEKRLAKVKIAEYQTYWKYLLNKNVNVINQDTYNKCLSRVDIINNNKEIFDLINPDTGLFNNVEVYAEKYLQAKLDNYKFGLHGYIDKYIIDHDKKMITIIDFKTTSKVLNKFEDTIEFYKYDLQAPIYKKLVYFNNKEYESYDFCFKFVVIDLYDHVSVFNVTEETMKNWDSMLEESLEIGNYHYSNNKYDVPFGFEKEKNI